jgi:hypothetical protein
MPHVVALELETGAMGPQFAHPALHLCWNSAGDWSGLPVRGSRAMEPVMAQVMMILLERNIVKLGSLLQISV